VCLLAAAAPAATLDVHRHQLELMPLPKAALGAAARSLPLDRDSGIQSNAAASRSNNGNPTAAALDRAGRLTGYGLGYSDNEARALAAGHGLVEVQTQADLYLNPAAARAGVALWRRARIALGRKGTPGARVSTSLFPSGRPARGSFGAAVVINVRGKPPIYGFEVQFVQGPLVGSVDVFAADRGGRRALALSLARRLDARMQGVLRGRITGPPVQLPGRRAPSVSLRALALLPSDLGDGIVKHEGYVKRKKGSSVSEYVRLLSPAGPFVYLQEKVALFHSAAQASFTYSLLRKALSSAKALTRYDPSARARLTHYRPSPVQVEGGDEVSAVRADVIVKGAGAVVEGIVVMRVGRTTEFVIAASPPSVPLTEDAIRDLVAAAARRARSGLRG